jgi:hypothetical protein
MIAQGNALGFNDASNICPEGAMQNVVSKSRKARDRRGAEAPPTFLSRPFSAQIMGNRFPQGTDPG